MGFKKNSSKTYKVAEKDRTKLENWSRPDKAAEIVRKIKKDQKS